MNETPAGHILNVGIPSPPPSPSASSDPVGFYAIADCSLIGQQRNMCSFVLCLFPLAFSPFASPHPIFNGPSCEPIAHPLSSPMIFSVVFCKMYAGYRYTHIVVYRATVAMTSSNSRFSISSRGALVRCGAALRRGIATWSRLRH